MDRRPRAFALIVVLVATTVVFAIAVQGAVLARAASAEASALLTRARHEREARSAVSIALAGLLAGPAPGAPDPDDDADSSGGGGALDSIDDDQLPEMPAAMRELIGRLSGETPPDSGAEPAQRTGGDRAGQRRRASLHDALLRAGMPAAPIEVDLGERALRVTLLDAGAGLDVNSATEDELARLLRLHAVEAPLDTRIAQEIADYRDEDDFVRERGAEAPDYARRGLAPRNGPLQSLEELLFLPSMTPDILARLRADLRVGGDARLHAATASEAALLAIDGMTPAGAQRLLARRAEGPMTREDLERALSPASTGALDRLRLDPSDRLLAVVEPGTGGGPAFEVEVSLAGARRIQFLAVRPHPERRAP